MQKHGKHYRKPTTRKTPNKNQIIQINKPINRHQTQQSTIQLYTIPSKQTPTPKSNNQNIKIIQKHQTTQN